MSSPIDFQFYPTPAALRTKAWRKFKETTYTRVLDPSAGMGDLLPTADDAAWLPEPAQQDHGYLVRQLLPRIDCAEIDVRRHPVLRERGYTVVGVDFLEMHDLAQYSHIVMNPPFAAGARHLLHAWDGLFAGEIVAILNAETVRNPCSKERQRLATVIADHGDVEFVGTAFAGAERSTDVEVAIVHLQKHAGVDILLEQWRAGLTEARPMEETDLGLDRQISVPRAEIEDLVAAYNAAVRAAKEQAIANQKVKFYTSFFQAGTIGQQSQEGVRSAIQASLQEVVETLRADAWRTLLLRSRFSEKLSSGAQDRLQREFASVQQLEFSLHNAYSFVQGILESAGTLQVEMACDVFDLICCYHSENRVWYRGWKSNDKHRTAGWRIKQTRFILPVGCSYSGFIGWEAKRKLADIDKVFSMLDGLAQTHYGLSQAIEHDDEALRAAERVQTRYFDIRYYRGARTMHFYPRSQAIMDRLNKLVGQARGWLPPAEEPVSKEFWLQYEQAEKLAKHVHISHNDEWATRYGHTTRTAETDAAMARIDAALAKAHREAGIVEAIEFHREAGADQGELALAYTG